ncbi:MAG TPA: transglutaminase-like domain-containing protein [Flavisolibacter sp.]|nr:transglutaminase-like domain-containing protein [Flavisolibacter sp.]
MKYTIKKLFLILLAGCTQAQAQTDWKKQFPDEEAVYTRLSCHVNIKREGDKLVATSDYAEDLVFLSDNSVKLMSKGYIYHSGFSELRKWDAYTQQPEEKKKFKVANASTASNRDDYIFFDDSKYTSFDYTGGMVGGTRHLDYQLFHKDICLLFPYYFERYFPVAEAELNITFPSDVKLKYLAKGLDSANIRFSESTKKDKTTYTFRISGLKGSRSYPDAPDNSWYATHLIFYVAEVKENGSWKNMLNGPADLYRYNYNFIRNLNRAPNTELKNITDSLTAGVSAPAEKAKKIYRWVQNHIKYVAFEDGLEGFIPREASLVCSRRFGDCKDMASILTTMLTHAGIPAYFTWIGTRDIPYDYTDVPLPISDNHMICTIRLGDEYIFLDATDNACIFGNPSSGIQGKQAMVSISENEYKIIRVPVLAKEKNSLRDSTFLELTDRGITGQLRVHLTGYYASNLYQMLGYKNEEEREKYFKSVFQRGSNKIRFSNWKVITEPDQDEIWIRADLELNDYAKKLGDEWFLNLNLFKWYEHEEIDYPKRRIPIDFNFLNQRRYFTTLKLPAGTKLSYLPKSNSYKNDVWGYFMDYAAEGNTVSLSQGFDTDQMILYPRQFEAWNKVLEHLFPNYKQTISITKN